MKKRILRPFFILPALRRGDDELPGMAVSHPGERKAAWNLVSVQVFFTFLRHLNGYAY
jgi:hypothetical protein